MRKQILRFNWASTSLGPRTDWAPLLHTLVELVLSSNQPMFLAWGVDRIWIYNDAFVAIAGDKHPASLGQPAREVWSEAWSELRPMFDRVFAGEAISMAGFRVALNRHGSLEAADFDFSYTPVRTELSSPVSGLFGVCIETTSQLEIGRQKLKMAERESSRILEMSRDLFAVASFDGRLLSVNPAWAQQLGRGESELLSRPFADFIHPDDLQETASVIEALIAGRPVHQFRVRLLKADGTPVAYAWSAVPEQDPPNGTFYTVGRDITDETVALAALRSAQEALRQAQKMESIGQLTGGLAHDFNNLLAAITGSLELIKRRSSVGKYDDIDRYVKLGLAGAQRAASLTHRLLAFARRQTLAPKVVTVNRLVSDMEELIRRTTGPQVALEVVAGVALWPVMVDAGQLESALLNLCINARDAMPDGGKLLIETANRRVDESSARSMGIDTGQYVSMCVSDNGVGMSPHVAERAFDPFFTTKPIGMGTGLGLSMIYGFAKQSGGHVRIYSEMEQGTMVCIYLPRHLGQIDEAADERLPAPADLHGNGRVVLVVDDEASVRTIVRDVLVELGFTVLEAADGIEALKILEAPGPLDLLISDVGLPGGMNGRQIADAARSFRSGLKVLFITGYAENAVLSHGHLDPGMHVLTKPFGLDSLVESVEKLVKTETPH